MELIVIALLALIIGAESFLLYKQSQETEDKILSLTKDILKQQSEKTVISVPFAETTDGQAKDPDRIPLDEISDEDFIKAVKKSINKPEMVDEEAEKAKEEVLG